MNVPIHEGFCVRPLPYYLGWFENSYPRIPLNLYYGQFCLQCMNGIQGKKKAGREWNHLLDTMVTIIKYKKIAMDHAIYIKVFSEKC